MNPLPKITAIINTIQVLRPGPRRWISYRVHLDDPIGSLPDIKGLADLVVRHTSNGTTRELHRPSMALVRVSNDSSLDISEDDYVVPVKFTFGNRKVVGVEVKDVTDAQRAMLLGNDRDTKSTPSESVLTSAPSSSARWPPRSWWCWWWSRRSGRPRRAPR